MSSSRPITMINLSGEGEVHEAMTRFQALLTPDPSSTPKAEQDRASLQLCGVVEQSNLRWWKRRGPAMPAGKALLLVVAPYSQYDLVLLDLIDEALAPRRGASVPVYVANLQHYETVEQLHADIPAINHAPPQTPVAAIWKRQFGLAACMELPEEAIEAKVICQVDRRNGMIGMSGPVSGGEPCPCLTV